MNIETSLQWFYNRKGSVTYSMVSRLGPSSFDCSSSVYLALIAGGFFPASKWVGNTDSLYGDLENNGWIQVQPDARGYIAARRGDVFLWGKRGASTGSLGHTGMFVDADNIIHCSYGYNGIAISNHDWLSAINGYPELTIYRYTGVMTPPATNAVDQILEVGSVIKFPQTYTADDVQLIGGIWQVRCNELCPKGFTWEDNGIPAEPLVELTDNYRTSDQELEIGSKFVIPGKFTVLDLGESDGMWLALIEWNGLKFWVDVATATEIASSDSGTSAPGTRPVVSTPEVPNSTPVPTDNPSTSPTDTVEPPKQETSPTEPPTTPTTEPNNQPPVNETKPKEEPMAFSKEQQKELAVATQSVLDANTDFTPVISDNIKTIAYFATDITGVLSGLVFTILAVFHVLDGVVAVTVNAAIVAALLGVKQTFRLSSKKQ